MEISEKYKIESDSLNVTLFEKKLFQGIGRGRPSKKKVGDESWQPVAYFSSPQNALDYLVTQEIKGTGMKDLKTVVDKIKELESIIRGIKIPMKLPSEYSK